MSILNQYASMTEAAMHFVDCFQNGREIPGGLAYRHALAQSRLDGTVESLERIDTLLDQVRARYQPRYERFLAQQEQLNFLYLLGFYTGLTVAIRSGAPKRWISYDQLLARDPAVGSVWPRAFESSAICLLKSPTGNERQFLPLVPIVVRLFEGPHEKSVAFSAAGFL